MDSFSVALWGGPVPHSSHYVPLTAAWFVGGPLGLAGGSRPVLFFSPQPAAISMETGATMPPCRQVKASYSTWKVLQPWRVSVIFFCGSNLQICWLIGWSSSFLKNMLYPWYLLISHFSSVYHMWKKCCPFYRPHDIPIYIHIYIHSTYSWSPFLITSIIRH